MHTGCAKKRPINDELAWTIERMRSLYKKSDDVRKLMRREDWEHFQDAYMRYCADNVVDLDYDSGQKVEDNTAENLIVLSDSDTESSTSSFQSCASSPNAGADSESERMQCDLWERLQETTGLLLEADPKTLARMPSNVLDMRELIEDCPQRFCGMDDEIKAFHIACNAWEERRSANAREERRSAGRAPTLKRPKHNHDDEQLRLTQDEIEQMAAVEEMEKEKRKKQWKKLTRFLRREGLRPVDTKRDGGCLFTAIGHRLGKRGKDVRQDVVEALLDMRGMKLLAMPFEQFCCDTTGVPDFDQYVKNMEKQDQWGGQPELFAASWLYDIKICVKDTTTGQDQITHMPNREPGDTIVIVWDGNHYTATEPLQ